MRIASRRPFEHSHADSSSALVTSKSWPSQTDRHSEWRVGGGSHGAVVCEVNGAKFRTLGNVFSKQDSCAARLSPATRIWRHWLVTGLFFTSRTLSGNTAGVQRHIVGANQSSIQSPVAVAELTFSPMRRLTSLSHALGLVP
jgi:hypothetical protein